MLKKVVRNRVLQHLAFWSIAFYSLLKNFETTSVIVPVDLIYTSIFIIFLMASTYINLLVLIPFFFQKGRYVLYALLLILLLLLSTWVYMHGFDLIVELMFDGYYLISYIDFWETMKYFVIFIGISSLLHFSKSWFLYREAEIRLAVTQKEKIAAELSALKGQINPHFLFNSLNSIYSLVLNNNDRAPKALIKLSDALRYVIYESDHDKVSLEKEIDFVRNYVELQQLRLSAKDEVNLSIKGDLHQQEIAPLLLLPIIENAFKYGTKGEKHSSLVSIDISIEEDRLQLSAENSLGQIDETGLEISGGTGLSNLKQRLELIYPEHHQLIIEPGDNNFKVELQIGL